MSVTKTEKLCVRCAHPVDAYECRCVFCLWQYKDPGIECMCGYLNRTMADNERAKYPVIICKACKRVL